MERLKFEIEIKAHREVVYRHILEKESFEKWSAIFSPTSRYKGDWKEGSTIHFLSTDENGVSGMISLVRANKPPHYIGLNHIGFIQNGQEFTEGPNAEAFKGAEENYILEDSEIGTLLKVESDTLPEWKEFFQESWPKSLLIIKQMSEEQEHNSQ